MERSHSRYMKPIPNSDFDFPSLTRAMTGYREGGWTSAMFVIHNTFLADHLTYPLSAVWPTAILLHPSRVYVVIGHRNLLSCWPIRMCPHYWPFGCHLLFYYPQTQTLRYSLLVDHGMHHRYRHFGHFSTF